MAEVDVKKTIDSKISEMKSMYSSLRNKSDDFVFSAVCLKNNLFKNPCLSFNEEIILESVVDGCSDGGVDIMISDPNSETSDFILAQAK